MLQQQRSPVVEPQQDSIVRSGFDRDRAINFAPRKSATPRNAGCVASISPMATEPPAAICAAERSSSPLTGKVVREVERWPAASNTRPPFSTYERSAVVCAASSRPASVTTTKL